jgi:hypothetical protein
LIPSAASQTDTKSCRQYNVHAAAIEPLSCLTSLTDLELSRCHLIPAVSGLISALANLTRLTRLSLSNSPCGLRGIATLWAAAGRLTTLRELDVRGTMSCGFACWDGGRRSDVCAAVEALAALTSLTVLHAG